jgi:predicted PurR-regulated permease PerM
MPFLQTPRDRAALLILVLATGVLIGLSPFFSGLFGAAVLYVICVKPYTRLARAINPGVAAAITLTGALLIIAATARISTIVSLRRPLMRPRASEQHGIRANRRVPHWRMQLGGELAKASGTITSWLSTRLLSFVGSATSAVLNLVIAFFGLYYMLRSDDNTWPSMRQYIPFSARTADALRDRFFNVTEATLLGTFLIAVLQGTLVGTGFGIVGLSNPFFWGTVTAFASILPVLGTALVWLPAVLVLVVQNRYGAAITMLVIGAGIASNIDNLIRPLVYRRVSHIHPMITLVGAFMGVKYFGLLGVLLGPLAIAYLFELLKFYREEYTANDGAETPAIASER